MPLGANKVALYGASADTGSAVLLSTATASSSASIEFTLPTAYKQVTFGFYNVTPATSGAQFDFQVNASGGSGFNETITSTYFRAKHFENDSGTAFNYETGMDQAQGTSYQTISSSLYNAADAGTSGEMSLLSPNSTTYVKHWYCTFSAMCYDASSLPYIQELFAAGYINNTTNLSEISFKCSSGNISSGTIKMWGIK